MALGAAEAAGRLRGRDVPEEDGAVAADAGKRRVVGRDAEVEDFIAVRRVGLDELGCRGRGEGVGCRSGGRPGWVVEADGTVCGAG